MVHDTHLYDLLSVPATATLEEITKSYKRLALRYHPDKTNHDPILTEKFKDATRAYEILKDSCQRQVYDVYGEEGLDGSVTVNFQHPTAQAAHPGQFPYQQALTLFSQIFNDMSSVFHGSLAFNNNFHSFGFNAQCQNMSRHVMPAPPDPNANVLRRGADIHHTFNVTLADMYYGKVVKFQLPKTTKCSVCDGAGCFNPRTCRVCKGSGRIVITMTDQFSKCQEYCSCTACRGTGTYYNKRDKCPLCDNGYLTVKKIIKVNILSGSKDGDQCILKGQSDEGKNIIPGNLIIHLKEMPHKTLVRRFNDLYMEQDIDLRTALLGGSIVIHDFIRKDHDLQIFINSHGQSALNASVDPSIEMGEVVGTINLGSVKIVKGLGMPINKDIKQGVYLQGTNYKPNDLDLYKRGDLFIRFNVQIPTLSEFVGKDDLLLLSRILPQSAAVESNNPTQVHHLSNLRNDSVSGNPSSSPTNFAIDEAANNIQIEEAAAPLSDEYDYDHLDLDSQDDVEEEDKHFYEAQWSKDVDVLKRRKNNKDSPIPAKLKKPDHDPRQGVLT